MEDVEAPSEKRRQCSFDDCTAQGLDYHAKSCASVSLAIRLLDTDWVETPHCSSPARHMQRAQYPLLCIVGLCNNHKNNCDILRYSYKIIVVIYKFCNNWSRQQSHKRLLHVASKSHE